MRKNNSSTSKLVLYYQKKQKKNRVKHNTWTHNISAGNEYCLSLKMSIHENLQLLIEIFHFAHSQPVCHLYYAKHADGCTPHTNIEWLYGAFSMHCH